MILVGNFQTSNEAISKYRATMNHDDPGPFQLQRSGVLSIHAIEMLRMGGPVLNIAVGAIALMIGRANFVRVWHLLAELCCLPVGATPDAPGRGSASSLNWSRSQF